MADARSVASAARQPDLTQESDLDALTRQLSRKQSRTESTMRREEQEEMKQEALQLEGLLERVFGANDEANADQKHNPGLFFENVTVWGEGVGATYYGTVLPALSSLRSLFSARKHHTPKRAILSNFTGVVHPGEMVFVLGRPGSGCTSFLKTISGYDDDFAGIDGNVRYGPLSVEDMKKAYRGDVAFNDERDIHLATLTVKQTFEFAAKCRTPRAKDRPGHQTRKQFHETFLSVLGKVFGLEKVMHTKIGNEFIRGVSGGEKKRVSIGEVLTTRALITAWDNSTRGLDSSSAVAYVKSLRALTNLTNGSTFVSLYQASESLWDLFDKVLLIDNGRMVYFGSVENAEPYFKRIGFVRPSRSTSTDFLASITDPAARPYDPERDPSLPPPPRTADELEKAWLESEERAQMERDVQVYKEKFGYLSAEEAAAGGAGEEGHGHRHRKGEHGSGSGPAMTPEAREKEKQRQSMKRSNYVIELWRQILYLCVRQYQLTWGDKMSLTAKFGGSIFQALIVGSVFFNQPQVASSAFTLGGVMFFALLFQALQGLAEMSAAFETRPVIQRHKAFSFYRPGAVPLAQIAADIPVLFVQVVLFSLILYFMTGLSRTPSQFFIFILFLYITSFVMYGVFRALAAVSTSLDVATRFAGITVQAIIVYSGYMVPYNQMRYYFRWLPWINPVYYGYESLITNEFNSASLQCEGTRQYVPNGPGFTDPEFGSCSLGGSKPGETSVSGAAYILFQYGYTRKHLWRNLGALFGFFLLFTLITIYGFEYMRSKKGSGSIVQYKRGHAPEAVEEALDKPEIIDEERGGGLKTKASSQSETASSGTRTEDKDDAIRPHHSIYTWSNVNYTVNVKGGRRALLQDVEGWVKPGRLTALMGASGAGKTTLLSALSQRLPTATGQFDMDGKPLPPAFQRMCGFVEQADVHEPFQTVREALRFSALLRQPAEVSREEKFAYVESVIRLLEMEDIAEAQVGLPTDGGLSVEQRKRVTIGVELAAKPALLVFLDEPTSGLDGQGAWNLIRFLKKLTAAGQAVLATIHQPSSVLFEEFDEVLALSYGGRTSYFGELGPDCTTMTDFFRRNGARKIRPGENPAEYMLAQTTNEAGDNEWPDIWRDSPEHKRIQDEIANLRATRKDHPVADDVDTVSIYAAPLSVQTKEIFRRTFTSYWRDTRYITGKFALHITTALFNGFTFFQLGTAYADLQGRLFTIFVTLTISPPLIQQLQPKFLNIRSIYEAREGKAKIYSWVPLIASAIAAEIPYSLVAGSIYFSLWWFTVGLPQGGRAAFGYMMVLLFELYYVSFGQFLASMAPNALFASLLVPIFFSFVVLFCGVLVPPTAMPTFWSSWMFHLTPFRYLVGAFLSDVLHDVPINCTLREYAVFSPPSGQTCEQYLQSYFAGGAPGYLNNPSATSDCQVCPYNVGDEYLATLEIYWSQRWQYVGYFIAYIVFNWALVFILTAIFRTHDLSFLSLFKRRAKKTPSKTTPVKAPNSSPTLASTPAEGSVNQAEKGELNEAPGTIAQSTTATETV